MYKIFYHHCNKCLDPSLWNITLKDIKNHSPHKMTWMEKVLKQSTILCSSHYTVHWIPSAVQWEGPRGSGNKHHIIGSACHISWLCQQGQHQVGWYWLLYLVIVSALLAIAGFIYAYVVNLLKKKKSSSIFSFITFF